MALKKKILAALLNSSSSGAAGSAALDDAQLTDLVSLYVPLKNSLVLTNGTGDPTFTRASVATVWGYAAAANEADGQTLLSVASGEARFTGARRVSEGVWSNLFADGSAIPDSTLKGYLAEGERTNRCLYSNDFSNAAWVASNVTKGADNHTAPDGTASAYSLTATAANGTVIQDLGVVASASKTGGFYLKRKTGTGNIDITMDGGTGWTTVAVTSTWTRFEKNQTLADEDFGIRLVTSGDAVYVWNGQVETAAFLSSPVTTTSAAVPRAADVLTYPTSGNFSDTAGTCYAEFYRANAIGVIYPRVVGDTVSDSTPLYLQGGTSKVAIYDLSTEVATAGTFSTSSINKAASKWEGAAMSVCLGGGAVASGVYDGSYNLTALGIGANATTNQLFGNIRNVTIWQLAVPSYNLIDITTNGLPF